MEGGQDPFGCLRVSRGRIERCWTLKAPSSRAILGGRCGGSPPTLRGSAIEARDPRVTSRGCQLESWWCTPTTSGSRASRSRSRRQRWRWPHANSELLRAFRRVTADRSGSLPRSRHPRVVRWRQIANPSFEPKSGLRAGQRFEGTASESKARRCAWYPCHDGSRQVRCPSATPTGGSTAAAREPNLRAGIRSSDRPMACGDGERVIWSDTKCTVSASPRIEPGPSPERRPHGWLEGDSPQV